EARSRRTGSRARRGRRGARDGERAPWTGAMLRASWSKSLTVSSAPRGVPQQPELVVVSGSVERREPLTNAEISLGREPGNTIVIEDGYLSRRHCRFARRGDRVSVLDFKSYNGTFVNGQKIHEEAFLGPGDVVKIGRTTIYVDWKDGQDSQGL